ncbi:hypothetical protein D2V08_13840 [Flagellimonas lutimaris]|uniref:Uncharacterized protein n=1 Tax=Flagellimonas lutimaris TaxID=475082 RepID=A0A3A1N6V9_9FLAO|nr:hypothetical protein D2V08_13840 [Allomuricauda lutimaris]
MIKQFVFIESHLWTATTLSGGFLFTLPSSHHKIVTYKGQGSGKEHPVQAQAVPRDRTPKKEMDYENGLGPDTPKVYTSVMGQRDKTNPETIKRISHNYSHNIN